MCWKVVQPVPDIALVYSNGSRGGHTRPVACCERGAVGQVLRCAVLGTLGVEQFSAVSLGSLLLREEFAWAFD